MVPNTVPTKPANAADLSDSENIQGPRMPRLMFSIVKEQPIQKAAVFHVVCLATVISLALSRDGGPVPAAEIGKGNAAVILNPMM